MSTSQQSRTGATLDVDHSDGAYRAWLKDAVRKVQADANRSADTHLLLFPLPEEWGIDLYLKDESTHPTGSLKHRLARSLFLYGLCNGWIRPGRPVIEASSGSTAVSEAYFAGLIGVRGVGRESRMRWVATLALMLAMPATALSGYAAIKGEISEKLSVRWAAGLGPAWAR